MSAMTASTTTQIRSDTDIQLDVLDELDWTPDVEPAHIGVSVHDGVVTLSGEVETYAERLAAKDAARRVAGVTGIADDLEVEASAAYKHTDTQVAEGVVAALRLRADVPRGAVECEVTNGAVRLTGQVAWNFQRDAARNAAQHVPGVRSVINDITLTPRASASDAADRIKKALVRNAELDADAITVRMSGNEVTLTGHVRSWAEKQQATAAAWASPHVSKVHNEILVRA